MAGTEILDAGTLFAEGGAAPPLGGSALTPDRPLRPLLTVKQLIPPVRPGAVRRARLEQQLRHLDRVPHWLDLCDERIAGDTVVRNWRNARAAALMIRALIGLPDRESARAVELCEQAVALESDGSGRPIALMALGRPTEGSRQAEVGRERGLEMGDLA